ncbi:hypothetical protein L249_4813 [Ophiocordyceps polyrhachis-furcata BCC 54312]|uniref:DSC E3 ubiquitin ligase complex subunit A n=1 Tax=Ophiocordyceps polyrhachis-furcata BCC 54312 TaxID=1330021 RepID=A0A367L2V9_9HYPO|nr:hypothetical protein L249_4813 [Ophiocordyceps polyrhachis-furcata BCC 54312]
MAFYRHPVVGLILVLLLLWSFFPESENRSTTLSEIATSHLSRYRDALDTLSASAWGDFSPDAAPANTTSRFLNLTGFREVDGFAWDDLTKFRERVLRLSRHAISPVAGRQLWDVAQGDPVWANPSGTLRGEWVRRSGSVSRRYDSYNLSLSVPAMDWVGDRVEWARNITGAQGRMTLRLEANRTVIRYDDMAPDTRPLSGGSIRDIKGAVIIEDLDGSGQSWDMRLYGVHWPRQGVILMTTTSEKFEGIFGLPHLAPSPDFFLSSQMMLNDTLERVISRKQRNIKVDPNIPWNSNVGSPLYTAYPSPNCELVMYAQVLPPLERAMDGAASSEERLRAIESEVENPIGAAVGPIPPLELSVIVYSPDCAFFLETNGPPDFLPSKRSHLVGLKAASHTTRVKRWISAFALVIFAQVYLFKQQIQETFTPSTIARISFWTISAMTIVDGIAFIAALTWIPSSRATYQPTALFAFAAFLSTLTAGCLLAKIHEAQLPESRSRRDANPGDGRAAPADAGFAPEPIIVPSDQDVDAEITAAASAVPRAATGGSLPSPQQTFQSVVGRLFIFSLCIIFVAVSSSTWPPGSRSVFLSLCAFVYLSLWVPQIYRNTMRNCRHSMSWRFVIGQTVLRLLPVAYFWIHEDNFLFARPDRTAFSVLFCWVSLQLAVLAVQEVMGPRFGVPDSWTPDGWDYHPVLHEEAIEGGRLPIGLAAGASWHGSDAASKSGNVRVVECAICHEPVDVPVVKAGGEEDGSVKSVFARRLYMMTPCRHIFHTRCLEVWMRYRLQCPICREDLPPI